MAGRLLCCSDLPPDSPRQQNSESVRRSSISGEATLPRPTAVPTYLLVAWVSGIPSCQTSDALEPHQRGALPLSPVDAPATVEVRAHLEWAEPETEGFRVLLDLTNTGADTAQVESGECNVRIRAYAAAELAEPAIWDDHFIENVACPAVLYVHRIAPGENSTAERIIRASIVADWPPPRRAYYGVVIRLNGERLVLPAGVLTRY